MTQNLAPPFTIPSNVPASVRSYIIECVAHNLNEDEWRIIERLATDPLILREWKFLNGKRDNGEFLYPAKCEWGQSQIEAQQRAYGWLFHCAYCFARDRKRVWRDDEVEKVRRELTEEAERHRKKAAEANETAKQLGLAAVRLLQAGSPYIEIWKKAETYMVQATVHGDHAESLASLAWELMTPGDPLLVQRYRADVEIKGVQTLLSLQLYESFGRHMDNVAGAFASVALGVPRQSRETSRSSRRTKP